MTFTDFVKRHGVGPKQYYLSPLTVSRPLALSMFEPIMPFTSVSDNSGANFPINSEGEIVPDTLWSDEVFPPASHQREDAAFMSHPDEDRNPQTADYSPERSETHTPATGYDEPEGLLIQDVIMIIKSALGEILKVIISTQLKSECGGCTQISGWCFHTCGALPVSEAPFYFYRACEKLRIPELIPTLLAILHLEGFNLHPQCVHGAVETYLSEPRDDGDILLSLNYMEIAARGYARDSITKVLSEAKLHWEVV